MSERKKQEMVEVVESALAGEFERAGAASAKPHSGLAAGLAGGGGEGVSGLRQVATPGADRTDARGGLPQCVW